MYRIPTHINAHSHHHHVQINSVLNTHLTELSIRYNDIESRETNTQDYFTTQWLHQETDRESDKNTN